MNNLFAFHGIDHKTGVTMIAQSAAELIAAQNSNINVLFISLNGRKNGEYVEESVKTIDEFKLQMDSQMIISRDFAKACRRKRNLYILAGLSNEQEQRYYFPNSAQYLLEAIRGSFEIIIADTGSELDNGLALGGMSAAAKNYLILTQLESSLCRYEGMAQWFEKAQIKFDRFLINKFYQEDPHTISYITERLCMNKEMIFKIRASSHDRHAEMDHKTLIHFKSDTYLSDITAIANEMLEVAGLPLIKVQRKNRLWKNFI